MEAELKKILASSPWNKTEIENWRNILNAGQSGEFILKADADVIASYNRKCNKANYFIHTSLLPQPFIGNPEAPIWILNQNPGYCEIDHYEMLGEKTKIQEWMNKNNITLRPETENRDSLEKRQKMILEQLTFANPIDFYILDESFHTNKHAGNGAFGGYEWWKQNLLGTENSALFCKGDKKMLSKFFALEISPYHSKNFDRKISMKTAHYTFWKELISYAFKRGKLLICRKMQIVEEIQKIPDFERNKDNVLRFVSQRTFLSNGNLISLEDYARSEKIEDAKKHAADLIYAVLNKKSE